MLRSVTVILYFFHISIITKNHFNEQREHQDLTTKVIHHLGQDSRGGLAEASTKYHGVSKYGQHILHSQYGKNKPNPIYPIERKKFAYDHESIGSGVRKIDRSVKYEKFI